MDHPASSSQDDPAPSPSDRPFGLWDSPITAQHVAGSRRFGDVQLCPDGVHAVWLEERSDRGVLVAAHLPSGGAPRDLTGPEISVRARIGYGGGDFGIASNAVYFAGEARGPESNRLYRVPLDVAAGPPAPIAPPLGLCADPRISPDGRQLLYVSSLEDVDGLALIPADGSAWPIRVVQESDFVMQPRWHPDGRQIAWVAWDHPNMPWDGTRLRVGRLEAGQVVDARTLAGGEDESIFQPEFTPDGEGLLFASDADGYWNLRHVDLRTGEIRILTAGPYEVGEPAWRQGQRVFVVAGDGRILFTRSERGARRLHRIAVDAPGLAPGSDDRPPTTTNADDRPGNVPDSIAGPITDHAFLSQLSADARGERLALIASGPTRPHRAVLVDPEDGAVRTLAHADPETLPASVLADAKPLTWTGHDGEDVHGLFYAPQNEAFQGRGHPPLIVYVHGGPTSQVPAAWRAQAQFFTSRGFAVLDVNYRGSTGHGRAYRNKLRGAWGEYDVEDARTGALALVESGRVDRERLAIFGGSAGGFTVLQSLIVHPGLYRAGVCLYGVSNQFALAAETHKFESRYTDTLLGPLPDAAALYRERSPAFHADRIVDPLIVFQGAEDRVVPKAQSDVIVESLRRRGVPHAYHVYENEGHGWRRTETVVHFLEESLAFLRTHLVLA